ncbi:hypothetical protein D1872_322260 [compost metagenome]
MNVKFQMRVESDHVYIQERTELFTAFICRIICSDAAEADASAVFLFPGFVRSRFGDGRPGCAGLGMRP